MEPIEDSEVRRKRGSRAFLHMIVVKEVTVATRIFDRSSLNSCW